MEQNSIKQEIKLVNREFLSVGALEYVIGFDENTIGAKTSTGILTIEGTNLHIVKLDTDSGVLEVSGNVNALYFSEEKKKRGLFSLRG